MLQVSNCYFDIFNSLYELNLPEDMLQLLSNVSVHDELVGEHRMHGFR